MLSYIVLSILALTGSGLCFVIVIACITILKMFIQALLKLQQNTSTQTTASHFGWVCRVGQIMFDISPWKRVSLTQCIWWIIYCPMSTNQIIEKEDCPLGHSWLCLPSCLRRIHWVHWRDRCSDFGCLGWGFSWWRNGGQSAINGLGQRKHGHGHQSLCYVSVIPVSTLRWLMANLCRDYIQPVYILSSKYAFWVDWPTM